ncbi:Increased recombination centers 6 [Fusarium mundagurra]|uniref:Increased recombination centers 6 n=1 Tax=Fusarium mundagurra TaxID=1567541 RepID=A0A8H5Y902_9HYPO|nr:Increased recombination centers 6 [Fusarium mundagurra]
MASQTPPHLDSESVTSGQTATLQMPMHHYPEDQRQQQNATPYTDRSEDDPPPSYTVVDNEGPHANPFDLLPTSSSSLGLHPFKGTSNDKVVYYLDKRLDTDPEFLEQHISELAKEPPRPYVRIQGLDRKSGIDFDIHIELTPLLYQEMATRRSWRRIRAVNNFDKVRRGTATMTRAPGFGGSGPPEEGTPGVAQWCYRYFASTAATMTEAEMSSSSRRILAVALENETAVLSKLVKDLTGSAPESPDPSLGIAGTTHSLALKTPYYSTTVPIWLDLIASPSEWSESFLSPEAAEVLAVLGGVVVVFTAGPISSSKDHPAKELVEHIGKVLKKGLGGWEWDGVGLAIGVGGDGNEEEWDEICAEAGLEFVSLGGKGDTGRNEFGEKTGVARVKEALEANDWSQLEAPLSDSEFGDFETSSAKGDEDDKELDPQKMGFGFDKSDFEGLRRAIWESSQDVEEPSESSKAETSKEGAPGGIGLEDLDEDEIAKIEKMMRKLQAVREAGEGMGEEQRKRMAARAVEEVMRDL